jgi:fatty acid desaturase
MVQTKAVAEKPSRHATLHRDHDLHLPADLRTVNNLYGFMSLVANVGPLLGLLAAAPWMWREVGSVWVLVLMPFVGVFAYKLTIIMHDCAHRTLFSSSAVNKLVGTATSYLLASDFEAFTANHFAHHRIYGEAGDPQGDDYLHLQGRNRSAIVWHLVRPLLGYNLFKLGQFAPEAPDGDPPRDGLKVAPQRQTSRWSFFGGVLVAQVLLATIASGFWTYPYLVLLYPLSAATFGLFFSQVRGFAEHVADEARAEGGVVRTHLPNWFDRVFFYGLNFNYHVEHHLFPYVPSWQLPRVHVLIVERCHNAGTLSKSIIGTILRRLSMCPR